MMNMLKICIKTLVESSIGLCVLSSPTWSPSSCTVFRCGCCCCGGGGGSCFSILDYAPFEAGRHTHTHSLAHILTCPPTHAHLRMHSHGCRATALNDEFYPLKQLLVLLEQCMAHGLKKGISLTRRKGVFGVRFFVFFSCFGRLDAVMESAASRSVSQFSCLCSLFFVMCVLFSILFFVVEMEFFCRRM